MELHGVYLRAYIHARSSDEWKSGVTAGMTNSFLAATALALHDAHHGREPKTIDALLAAINGMCSEAVAVCA